MRSSTILIVAWMTLWLSGQPTLAATPEVTAMKGMVVASTGVGAAEAGLDLLKRGGTAMDAAMAVAMLQPCRALGSYVSYGGIITLVYFDAATRRVYSLDAGFNTVRGEKSPLTIPGASPPISSHPLSAARRRRRAAAPRSCPGSSPAWKLHTSDSGSGRSQRLPRLRFAVRTRDLR